MGDLYCEGNIAGGLNIGMTISLSMTKIKLPYLFCKRCFHQWIPRSQELPKVCPHCNSPYWNKERRKDIMKEKPKKKIKKDYDDRDIGEMTELAHDLGV